MARPVELRIERVSCSHSCSQPTTPEVAGNASPFFRCKSSVGTVFLHLGLLLFIGTLLCTAVMLFRSTKLLAAYSNSTHLHFNPIARVSRSVEDGESCSKASSPSVMSETPYSMSYVSINDRDQALKLANLLVENKLAACVQIIPKITSVYRWEGKVTQEDELLLLIKSKQSRLKDLTDFVVANHPYQVCEVVSLPIMHGNPAYLEWLGNEVPDVGKDV